MVNNEQNMHRALVKESGCLGGRKEEGSVASVLIKQIESYRVVCIIMVISEPKCYNS